MSGFWLVALAFVLIELCSVVSAKAAVVQGAQSPDTGTYPNLVVDSTGKLILSPSSTLTLTNSNLTINGTLTDRSGTTSGTANTSTVLTASNSARVYLLVQNPNTVGYLYINFTSAAGSTGNSITLAPGGSYVLEANFVTTEAVNIAGSLASMSYVAKEK